LVRISPSVLVGVAFLLALVALDARVALRGEPEPIAPAVMTRAAEEVRAIQKPGDILVHSPLFSMRELAGLGGLVIKPDLPPEELRKSHRVLLIDRADHPMGGLGRATETHEIGRPVMLRIFAPTGESGAILFDLVTNYERAEMRIERPAGNVTSRCRDKRAEGGFGCPGEPEWLYLAPRALTIEGKSANCVWAHPTNNGVIVIELPASPAPAPGKKLLLDVKAALTDDAATTPDGAPVRTDVVQGGAPKGGLTVPNRPGWVRTHVELEPDKPVELRVSTPKDGRRHHCLTAEISEGS
jgi:hypothetical protein